MPSKREITASGRSSACDGPWLSGAKRRCPSACVPVGVGPSGTVAAADPLLRAALAADSALLG
eukprot:14583031-Alexandrium_andersonii.AAC.1